MAVNLTVVALCAALLRFENKAGERRLERMSRGARIASLRIEDSVTRQIVRLKDLRGKTRVVLVAGASDNVVETMKSAEPLKDNLSKSNLLIVPFISGEDENVNVRNWRMQSYGKDEWSRWYESEREVAKARLSGKPDDVLVVIVRLDGKVGARSVGVPMWPKLIEEIAGLPQRDQYGKP